MRPNWSRRTRAPQIHSAHLLGMIIAISSRANILLTAGGTPKIGDFGLAKSGGGSGLTLSDAVVGTPSYMAPEQASGKVKTAGPAADVYGRVRSFMNWSWAALRSGEYPSPTRSSNYEHRSRFRHRSWFRESLATWSRSF